MAEHTLRLKAVIDTSSVNGQLGAIQQKYQTANKNLNQTTGQQGLGNLNKLNQTMSHLTSTIQRLERTIQNLNRITQQTARQPKVQQHNSGSATPFIPYNFNAPNLKPVRTRYGQLGTFTQMTEQRNLFDLIKKEVPKGNITPEMWIRQQMPGYEGIFAGGIKGSPAQRKAFNNEFGGTSFNEIYDDKNKEFTNLFNARYAQVNSVFDVDKQNREAQAKLNKQVARQSLSFNKAMKFAAGSYMLGGLGSDLEESNYTPARYTGHAVSAASQGLGMGAMALGMGMGPVGAAATGIGAAVIKIGESIAEEWAASIQKTADALHTANTAFDSLYSSLKKFEEFKFEKSLGTMNIQQLGSTRESARAEYQNAEAEYTEFQETWNAKQIDLRRKHSAGKISDDEYAQAMKDLADDGQELADAMKKAKERLDQVNSAYSSQQQQLDVMTNAQKQAAKIDAKLNEHKERLGKEDTPEYLDQKAKEAEAKMQFVQSEGGLEAYVENTNALKKKLLTTDKNSAAYDDLQNKIKIRENTASSYVDAQNEYVQYSTQSEALKKQQKEREEEEKKNLQKTLNAGVSEVDSQLDIRDKARESLQNQYDIANTKRFGIQKFLTGKDSYYTRTREAREKYLSSLDDARNAKTAEDQDKALKDAAKYKSDMEFGMQESGRFSDAIGNFLQEALSKTVAPNLDNVTSLASQGYMISDSDDKARLQMQLDYMQRLVDITQQIKDNQKDQIGNQLAVYS